MLTQGSGNSAIAFNWQEEVQTFMEQQKAISTNAISEAGGNVG